MSFEPDPRQTLYMLRLTFGAAEPRPRFCVVPDILIRRERNRFIKEEWPVLRSREQHKVGGSRCDFFLWAKLRIPAAKRRLQFLIQDLRAHLQQQVRAFQRPVG